MDIIVLTLVALFIIGIFLIFRMFWLWYWKIDKIVDLLSIMREELIEINQSTKIRTVTEIEKQELKKI